MKKDEMLAGLMAQLDGINEGVKQCLYTLQENAEVTRAIINDVLIGAAEGPDVSFNPEDYPESVEESIERRKNKGKELNIFDENFEEKILEESEKLTPKISKTMLEGPGGRPIEMYEIPVNENMSMEEIAKQFTDIINEIKGTEGTDNDKPWT